jgi:hypothetical protein
MAEELLPCIGTCIITESTRYSDPRVDLLLASIVPSVVTTAILPLLLLGMMRHG